MRMSYVWIYYSKLLWRSTRNVQLQQESCSRHTTHSSPSPARMDKWIEQTRFALKVEREEEEKRCALRIDNIVSSNGDNEVNKINANSLEKNGSCLLRLTLSGTTPGLFGRTKVMFQTKRGKSVGATISGLSVGTVVRLVSENNNNNTNKNDLLDLTKANGVVCSWSKVATSTDFFDVEIGVEFKEIPDCLLDIVEGSVSLTADAVSKQTFRLDVVPDRTTFDRVEKALAHLTTAYGDVWSKLLFPSSPTTKIVDLHASVPATAPFVPSAQLNDLQNEAVKIALFGNVPIFSLLGPPGTGKTTTVAEIVRRAVLEMNQRVLVVAPSNVAVDNVLASVVKPIKKSSGFLNAVVRLGHPARVHADVARFGLDAVLDASEGSALIEEARKDLQNLFLDNRNASSASTKKSSASSDSSSSSKKHLTTQQRRNEARELRREIKKREKSLVGDLLRHRAKVVFSTITSSAMLEKLLSTSSSTEYAFDMVIIDEAGQASEAFCYIPMKYLKPQNGKLILSGDSRQLGPTILSPKAVELGLAKTLMERVEKLIGYHMLQVQYRSNELIMKWASNESYESRLVAHESVRSIHLNDLLNSSTSSSVSLNELNPLSVLSLPEGLSPLVLYDTSGIEDAQEELVENQDYGVSNWFEADVCAYHVESLLRMGLLPRQVAVITPYSAQVELLQQRLSKVLEMGVEIKTVDGFQGQEKETIVISMVRSNRLGKIGFLNDARRMNVAITRAKRQCVVIGDTSTCKHDPFLKRMCEYFEENGSIASPPQNFVDLKNNNNNNKRNENTSTATKVVDSGTTKASKKMDRKPTTTGLKTSTNQTISETPSSSSAFKQGKVRTYDATENLRAAPTTKFSELISDEGEEDEDSKEVLVSATQEASLKSEDPNKNTEVLEKEEEEENVVATKAKKKKRGKSKKSSTKEIEPETDEVDDELDAFLDAEIASMKGCRYSACAAKNLDRSTGGIVCGHCRYLFCLKHRLPEIHGCGGDARAKASRLHQNGGSPALRPSERKVLEDKLAKSKASLADKRTAQVKKKT